MGLPGAPPRVIESELLKMVGERSSFGGTRLESCLVKDFALSAEWAGSQAWSRGSGQIVQMGLFSQDVGTSRQLLFDAFSNNCPEALRDLPAPTAFVVWSAQDGAMWAGTDPFGACALYYWRKGVRIGVSAQIDALLNLGWGSLNPNEETIAEFLRGPSRHFRDTFYSEIERVHPGHVLVFDAKGARQQRFFFPKPKQFLGVTRRDAYTEFRGSLRTAVQKAVGRSGALIHVSGGLDSSSVAAVAGQELPGSAANLVAGAAMFPGLDCDESRYIDVLSRQLPYPTRAWSGLDGEPSDLVLSDRTLRCTPTPPVGIGYGTAGDVRVATEFGIRRIVTGLGGNQIAWEEGYLTDLVRASQPLKFAKAAIEMDPALFVVPTGAQRQFLKGEVRSTLRALGLRRWWADHRYVPEEWEGPVLRSMPLSSPQWARLEEERSQAAECLSSAVHRGIWDQLTRARFLAALEFQWMRLANVGMVPIHPYLNVGLFDLVVSIPSSLRPWRSMSRGLQRYALRDVLPLELLRRRDRPSFDSAVTFHAVRLADRMREVLTGKSWLSEPWVNRQVLRRWLEESLNGTGSAVGESSRWALLRRACGLEVWLRREFG